MAASLHDADLILHICDKMHPSISRLAGSLSYRALLSRALAIARVRGKTLGALRFESDGKLIFDPEHPAAEFLNPDTVRKDAVILVAAFLGLLMKLIGDVVTVRIVCQVWPEVKAE
ncbi:MAG: hypothetical protein LC632_01635 [Xanthomonadaceae bacterium]|nr:hypothetical protein [Xanthomonadaceae bacterium]